MKTYKISIDKSKCLGCGACANILDTIFEIGDDGLVSMKNSKPENDLWTLEINEDQLVAVQEVIDSCPTQVIQIKK